MRILNAWRNAEYVGSFYYIDGKYGFQYDSSVRALSEIGKANANAKPSNVLQGEQNGI